MEGGSGGSGMEKGDGGLGSDGRSLRAGRGDDAVKVGAWNLERHGVWKKDEESSHLAGQGGVRGRSATSSGGHLGGELREAGASIEGTTDPPVLAEQSPKIGEGEGAWEEPPMDEHGAGKPAFEVPPDAAELIMEVEQRQQTGSGGDEYGSGARQGRTEVTGKEVNRPLQAPGGQQPGKGWQAAGAGSEVCGTSSTAGEPSTVDAKLKVPLKTSTAVEGTCNVSQASSGDGVETRRSKSKEGTPWSSARPTGQM